MAGGGGASNRHGLFRCGVEIVTSSSGFSVWIGLGVVADQSSVIG